MIRYIFTILFLIGITLKVTAQEVPQLPSSESMDSLKTTVKKLMDFYDSYDDGSPESLKKAKYNDAVDDMSAGTATDQDKKDAYKISDAYIKGDKALEKDSEMPNQDPDSLEEILEETEEVKAAQDYMGQEKDSLMQMSYAEFEAYMLHANPSLGKRAIKEAYNKMHKDDGKQVPITVADDEMTPEQEQIWAIGVLLDPKNCVDFRKAIKIVKPEVTESEIQEACQKINK